MLDTDSIPKLERPKSRPRAETRRVLTPLSWVDSAEHLLMNVPREEEAFPTPIYGAMELFWCESNKG